MLPRLVLAFFLLFPFPITSAQGISPPEPSIWIAERHIGQQDFLPGRGAILPYEGEILVGGQYTLVLEMSLLQRWDFLADSCTCNQRGIFLERGGCLRTDGHWLAKQEFRRDQSKFILIHFFAPESLLRIQCQTRVVQCCACCENFCERLMPPLEPYPSFPVSISCSYPIGLAPAPPPLPIPIVPVLAIPASPAISACWVPLLGECPSAFPQWLLLLLFVLLCLLPLFCLCCILLPCLLFGWRRWRIRERIFPTRRAKEEFHPPPPVPPVVLPPPTPSQRIFVVDSSSQTNGLAQTTNIAPPPPIPLPDYEGRRKEGQRELGQFEEHAALGLSREDWRQAQPNPPWIWSREEIEEREEEEEEWQEVDTGRRSRIGNLGEEGQHYANWERRQGRGDYGHEQQQQQGGTGHRLGWTRFGTEPMRGEEEDHFQWRTTSPDGNNLRELDHRVHWQRSHF